MRKIRDVLHCVFELGLSARQVALRYGLARKTVSDYMTRFRLSRISWPLPDDLDDETLEEKLFPIKRANQRAKNAYIDFVEIHKESRKKGFTLQAMYEETVLNQGLEGGLSYSQFCRQYKKYVRSLKISLRQTMVAGEIAFVDYAGQTMDITNANTGEIKKVQIFVGVLGASHYTFCEATESQQLHDWIDSHTRMFAFFGGVTKLVVHDNLKSAVTTPHRYAPLINESYHAMCRHYNTHPFAARVYRPKDKSRAELAVQIVTRWILFRLRKRKFFSLEELNQAIHQLAVDMNARPFRQLPGSRLSTWAEIEQPALQPLPNQPYEFAEWGKARAGDDYHVCVANHFYSVPHQMRGQVFDYRLTTGHIELLLKGRRIASHKRSNVPRGKTTDPSHQPPAHRAFDGWTEEEAVQWATAIGPQTVAVVKAQLAKINNKNFGYRALQALKKILNEYGRHRLESACAYGMSCGATTTTGLRTILDRNLDETYDAPSILSTLTGVAKKIDHENVRGAGYYEHVLNTALE